MKYGWLYELMLVLENRGKAYRDLLQQAIVYQFAAGGFFLFCFVFLNQQNDTLKTIKISLGLKASVIATVMLATKQQICQKQMKKNCEKSHTLLTP